MSDSRNYTQAEGGPTLLPPHQPCSPGQKAGVGGMQLGVGGAGKMWHAACTSIRPKPRRAFGPSFLPSSGPGSVGWGCASLPKSSAFSRPSEGGGGLGRTQLFPGEPGKTNWTLGARPNEPGGAAGLPQQPALSQPRRHLVALETLGVVLSPQSRRVCLPVG